MYRPAHFRNEDPGLLREIIAQNPLAVLISSGSQGLEINHLPLLLEEDGSLHGKIVGHMARANPQWKSFEAGTELTAIFRGPQGYISPRWYSGALNVPTWNYAAIHVRGRPRLIRDKDQVVGALEKMVRHMEAGAETPWDYRLPDDFHDDLLKAIVGFEIEITSIEAKLKLSQNREVEDRDGALRGLDAGSEAQRALATLMRKVGG